MADISTVNVIRFSGQTPTSVQDMKSFPDNEEGNKEAEQKFLEWVKSEWTAAGLGELNDNFAELLLENGWAETDEGFILLIHST